VSEFLTERSNRRYGLPGCNLTVQDLPPQARCQPDIRPRVSLTKINRPLHDAPVGKAYERGELDAQIK